MNSIIRDLPVGWWVTVSLPDGRIAVANAEALDEEQVVRTMRRILARRAKREQGDPGDYSKVAAWLDANPHRGR